MPGSYSGRFLLKPLCLLSGIITGHSFVFAFNDPLNSSVDCQFPDAGIDKHIQN